jgi:methenyltetrahydrofolate cyclohydrolase
VSLVELSLGAFLSEVASDSPAPGGGSAAALAGATAAALCDMACALTVGRDKFKDVREDIQGAQETARRLGARLRELVEEDAQAFLAISAARKLPRATEAEREARGRATQEAVLAAAKAPLETLESVRLLAGVAELAAEKGNPSCITDVGSAAELIRAAAMAASWNVRVNLPSLDDELMRQRLRSAAGKALNETLETVARIDGMVEARLEERSDS